MPKPLGFIKSKCKVLSWRDSTFACERLWLFRRMLLIIALWLFPYCTTNLV